MNPWALDATGLLVWGLVAHAVADWVLQNDWMASNKARRWPSKRRLNVILRHPAAYAHAGIHMALLAFVFGWVAAPLALVHLVIDTRAPVEWLSRLIRQTQPRGFVAVEAYAADPERRPYSFEFDEVTWAIRQHCEGAKPTSTEVQENLDRLMQDMREWTCPVFDIGTAVRLQVDQVWHVACIALAALVVTNL